MSDKMRDEFEAWAARRGLGIGKDYSGGYGTDVVRVAWEGWQACSAAIEVELPKVAEFASADLPDYVIDRCRAMLTAQGVKVKP